MSAATLLLMILLLPMLGVVGIVLARHQPDTREGVTLITSSLVAVLVVILANRFLDGEEFSVVIGEPLPGITIAFKLEALGVIFALVAGLLWIVTSIYAIGYMRSHNEKHQTRFFAAFAVAICCSMGIAFSANLFTLFLFYELLTLSTYPLVTHSGTAEAKKEGEYISDYYSEPPSASFYSAFLSPGLLLAPSPFRMPGFWRAKLIQPGPVCSMRYFSLVLVRPR